MGIRKIVFLFLDENICYGYSLESLQWGASNEYPLQMFLSRNKKNIDTFWLEKMPYQELCMIRCFHDLRWLLKSPVDLDRILSDLHRPWSCSIDAQVNLCLLWVPYVIRFVSFREYFIIVIFIPLDKALFQARQIDCFFLFCFVVFLFCFFFSAKIYQYVVGTY